MQIKLGILDDGDEIYDVMDNRIVIKRKNRSIEILDFIYDEEGMPRIQPASIIILFKSAEETNKKSNEYFILDEGDEIFRFQYNQLFIKKKNNDVEVFNISTENEGCCLSTNSIVLTFGNKVVSIKKPGSNIEVGTF